MSNCPQNIRSSSLRHLTLVIPRLLSGILKAHPLRLSALSKLLARSNQTSVNYNLEQQLFELFSLPTAGELPIGAVTALADQLLANRNYWLRADPVEFRTDLAAVYMMGNSHLSNTALEHPLEQLKTLLSLDGIKLHAPQITRWYLELETDPEIYTWPLTQVVGKDITPYLPTGPNQAYWRKLFTEIQMLLHYQSALPQENAINGVWLWGAGRLPKPVPVPWQKVWSNDVLARGLALLNNIPVAVAPANFEEWLETSQPQKNLLVLEEAMSVENVTKLESNWFTPLVRALKNKDISSLDLYLTEDRIYHLTSRTIRYFWRRNNS